MRIGWQKHFAVPEQVKASSTLSISCNRTAPMTPSYSMSRIPNEKVQRIAKAFAGRWRIVEMNNRNSDFLDLVEEAHLIFDGKSDGEIAFGAVKGFLDVRYGARDGLACAEFSWEGYDENDSACGRGWVVIDTVGMLVGHFYRHYGDDSEFACERG